MVLLFGSRCCYLYDDHPSIDSHQTSAILVPFDCLHHTEPTENADFNLDLCIFLVFVALCQMFVSDFSPLVRLLSF